MATPQASSITAPITTAGRGTTHQTVKAPRATAVLGTAEAAGSAANHGWAT